MPQILLAQAMLQARERVALVVTLPPPAGLQMVGDNMKMSFGWDISGALASPCDSSSWSYKCERWAFRG